MSERKLSGIEMFAFDVVMEPRENEPRGKIRRYGLLKLSCGAAAGYGVCLISEDFAPADLVRWSSCFGRLRGLTPEEASAAASADRWGARERHPAQYALLRGALADLLAALEARRAGARPACWAASPPGRRGTAPTLAPSRHPRAGTLPAAMRRTRRSAARRTRCCARRAALRRP